MATCVAPWWTPPDGCSRPKGPSALSLRAVAREAGVSPAAPYHHFKDKAELLDAVAQQGWDILRRPEVRGQGQRPSASTR